MQSERDGGGDRRGEAGGGLCEFKGIEENVAAEGVGRDKRMKVKVRER